MTSTGRGPAGMVLGRSLEPMDARAGGPLRVMRPYFMSADSKKTALEQAKQDARDAKVAEAKTRARQEAREKVAAAQGKADEIRDAVISDPIANADKIPKAFPLASKIVGVIALGVTAYIIIRIAKG